MRGRRRADDVGVHSGSTGAGQAAARLDPCDGFLGEVKDGWVNVFDRLDPVAGFDPLMGGDYRRAAPDVIEDTRSRTTASGGTFGHQVPARPALGETRPKMPTL